VDRSDVVIIKVLAQFFPSLYAAAIGGVDVR